MQPSDAARQSDFEARMVHFLGPARLHFLRVVVLLIRRDLKVKYRGSFIGYLWSMLNPLLSMLILGAVFSLFVKGIKNYHLYVLVGVLTWNIVTVSIVGGTNSIIGGAALLRKIRLPIWVLPSVPLGTAFANFVLALAPFFIVALISGFLPNWQILFLPYVMLCFLVFLGGISLVLGTLNVFFRDVGHVLEPVLSLMFYATPIIFDRTHGAIPPIMAKLLGFNPFTHFVEAFRSCLIARGELQFSELLLLAVLAVSSLGTGATVYKHNKKKIMFRI